MTQPNDVAQRVGEQAPAVWIGTLQSDLPRLGVRRRELASFLAVVSQLGLLFTALYLFRIEEQLGLVKLLPLIFVGFVVHAVLPLRLRLPCFLLLTWAAIGATFGLIYGLALIGLGLGLIGLCHLPIAFRARVGLVLLAAALLVALRAQWIPAPLPELPTLVLPILGAMFMFRLIIYLYDLRHESEPVSLWARLSYFFLLPNICFPLFPVVDFQIYLRTYYDRSSIEIYQKGLLWILRGMLHLLLYRVVYHHFVLSPAEVQGLGGVVQAIVSTYLLYLRISGQFHLIIGLLCLFGFNLPETHHLYLLASSFNDYWRRINIYWKDFMMKIFYYPTLMWARRWGMNTGMVVATVVVFAGTWLLHSYQWFWLRDAFPLTATDALFWGILGGLVVLNSLQEAKRGRKRRLGAQTWSVWAALRHSAKTVGMLVFIAVLWSLWSSSSVGEWVAMMAAAGQSGAGEFALLLAALALLIGLGVALQYALSRGWTLSLVGSNPPFRRSAVYTGVLALVLVLIGMPQVGARVVGNGEMGEVLASMQGTQLNEQDEADVERGYYEGLLDAQDYTNALWRNSPQGTPLDWQGVREVGAIRSTGDLLEFELIPSYSGTIKRLSFTTNRWGMRDQEYDKAKPPHTYRVALLGSSYVMGAGVAPDKNFEALVEERLNRERSGTAYDRYEILNFAVAGYAPYQQALLAQDRVFEFQPDALFFVSHANDAKRVFANLPRVMGTDVAISDPELKSILASAGVRPGMRRSDIERRLRPYGDRLVMWSYRRTVEAARQHGVVPVWIMIPRTTETSGKLTAEMEHLRRLASEAGFVTWSLAQAYQGEDRELLTLAPWDRHPNVRAYQLLADRLYQAVLENAQLLGLEPLRTPADGPAASSLDLRGY
ncbi:hypothetical protein BH23GEM7_BH23GEM7_20020 [soil metagenome]|nr:SGNH/GDSL hydrolase family protein [Gemmatimonadota bacterium]